MTWMRRGDGRMSALVGRRGENRVRRAGLHLLTGVVMGLAPVVGVPLPMVSWGGSAMLVLLAAFGLAQSAHVHRPRAKK